MNKEFSTKIIPQSLYRKSCEDAVERIQNLRSLTTDLEVFKLDKKGLSHLNETFVTLTTQIFSEILAIKHHPKLSVFLEPIFKQLATFNKGHNADTVESVESKTYLPILNLIKLHILEKYTHQLLVHGTHKIQYLVFKYLRHLPKHIGEMEGSDLLSIAQLEYIESFKNWDPKKADSIWQLAQFRINGAMKDHIRYITRSDPSRLYDWISDAGHLLKHQSESSEEQLENGTQLDAALKQLSPREKKVITLYTQNEQKFHEIAKKLDLSESQVSRIYKKAVQKLKEIIKKDL